MVGWRARFSGQELGAGGGVVEAGGVTGHGQQEAGCVGDDVSLATDDLLGRGGRFQASTPARRKAYDAPHLRQWLWGKPIGVRITRKGVDSSERLGPRRWVIERTKSCLTGYRRLNHRYERKPSNYLDFLGLASALCCYKTVPQTLYVGHCLFQATPRESPGVDPLLLRNQPPPGWMEA